jgi:hypothetical protein
VAAQISRLAAVVVERTITSKNLDADVFIGNISPATYLLKLTHCIKLSFRIFLTRGSNREGVGCLRATLYIYIHKLHKYIYNLRNTHDNTDLNRANTNAVKRYLKLTLKNLNYSNKIRN